MPQKEHPFPRLYQYTYVYFRYFMIKLQPKSPQKIITFERGVAKFLAPGIFMLTSLFLGWNNPIHGVLLKFQSEWCSTWVISQRIPHYYQEISGNFEIYFLFHLWYFLGFFGSVIPFVIFIVLNQGFSKWGVRHLRMGFRASNVYIYIQLVCVCVPASITH